MILHGSKVGNISAPVPLARWEPSRAGLNGTGIFCIDDLIDPAGQVVDFFVNQPSLLETKGGIFIRHAGVSIPGHGVNYVIYANARICLRGPYAMKSLLPPRWTPPQANENIWLCGPGNIGPTGSEQKYAAPHLYTQKRLAVGYYSIEVWASAGTDAYDVDGLGELVPYNSHITQQFHVKLTPL